MAACLWETPSFLSREDQGVWRGGRAPDLYSRKPAIWACRQRGFIALCSSKQHPPVSGKSFLLPGPCALSQTGISWSST